MRSWWASLTPEQKREKTARRDAERVREQDRRKQARRREVGTPEQKQKIAARLAVAHALAAGTLTKGTCSMHDSTCKGRIEGHHPDYDAPLDVEWLCRSHHERLHRNLNAGGGRLVVLHDSADSRDERQAA